MKTITTQQEAGFTLIELTLSSVILSVMLMFITQFFIGIVQLQRSTVAVRDATQNVRYGLDDITTQARLADHVSMTTSTVSPTAFNQLCVYQGGSLIQYFSITPPVGSLLHQILFKRYSIHDPAQGYTCNAITHYVASDVPVVSDSNASSADLTGLAVSGFRAQSTNITTIPILTVDLSMTSNYSDTDWVTYKCKTNTSEVCSITTIETSISLRGTQSAGF